MGCSSCASAASARARRAAPTPPTPEQLAKVEEHRQQLQDYVDNMPKQEISVMSDIELATNTGILYRPKQHWLPRFWVFVDENNHKFEAITLNVLLSQIIQYRYEKNLPEIPYLKEVVINFTMLSDDAYANHREPYTPNTDVSLSATQYMKAAYAYTKGTTIYTEDKLFASQEAAEKRAIVCSNCPYNRAVVNGHTKHTPGFAQTKFCKLKGERKTQVDGLLNICSKCTCMNSCKVHFSKEFINSSMTDDLKKDLNRDILSLANKPMKCWISDENIE